MPLNYDKKQPIINWKTVKSNVVFSLELQIYFRFFFLWVWLNFFKKIKCLEVFYWNKDLIKTVGFNYVFLYMCLLHICKAHITSICHFALSRHFFSLFTTYRSRPMLESERGRATKYNRQATGTGLFLLFDITRDRDSYRHMP